MLMNDLVLLALVLLSPFLVGVGIVVLVGIGIAAVYMLHLPLAVLFWYTDRRNDTHQSFWVCWKDATHTAPW